MGSRVVQSLETQFIFLHLTMDALTEPSCPTHIHGQASCTALSVCLSVGRDLRQGRMIAQREYRSSDGDHVVCRTKVDRRVTHHTTRVASPPARIERCALVCSSAISAQFVFGCTGDKTLSPDKTRAMIGVAKLILLLEVLALTSTCSDAATWSVALRHQRGGSDHHRALRTTSIPWGLRVPSIDPATGKTASVWARVFSTPPFEDVVPTDLKDLGDGRLVMEVAVGTPPQYIPLGFDLNSADIMMFNHKITGHDFYDHAKSSSYIANGTEVKIGEGMPIEIDGFVSEDVVTVGKRLRIPHFQFVELVSPDSFFKHFPVGVDGWVGLGNGAQPAGSPSLVRSMINAGLLDKPIVGVSLEKGNAKVTFGGIDPRYKDDDITFFPPAPLTYYEWGLPVNGVRVGGKSIVEGNAEAMIIPGLELIYGPNDHVDAIMEAVGADNYVLPCAGTGPDITLHFGTLAITLTKADYTVPVKDGICAFVMRPSGSNEPFWIIGTPVLRQVYVVLDYGSSSAEGRLGFAPVKPSS